VESFGGEGGEEEKGRTRRIPHLIGECFWKG